MVIFLKENGYFSATYYAHGWKAAKSRQENFLSMVLSDSNDFRPELLVFPNETDRTKGK